MKNDFRQKLHLEVSKGWLNDPNGLSFFKGKYHVFFQFSPYSAYGKGDKCWGHWESPDLINWTFKGTVLRPDSPADRSGVYSGCGLVSGDTLHLFYTGNVKKEGNFDYITSGREANVIDFEGTLMIIYHFRYRSSPSEVFLVWIICRFAITPFGAVEGITAVCQPKTENVVFTCFISE